MAGGGLRACERGMDGLVWGCGCDWVVCGSGVGLVGVVGAIRLVPKDTIKK